MDKCNKTHIRNYYLILFIVTYYNYESPLCENLIATIIMFIFTNYLFIKCLQ